MKHSVKIEPWRLRTQIGQRQAWSDFAWGPVGRYAIHVRVAAIIFIVYQTVAHDISVPLWLSQDLSALAAVHTYRSTVMDSSIHALRETMFHAKQNRGADPFLVDHMLCQSGQTDEKGATAFVNKYNSQVFFDPSLMLQERAAKRQASISANLLSRQQGCLSSGGGGG